MNLEKELQGEKLKLAEMREHLSSKDNEFRTQLSMKEVEAKEKLTSQVKRLEKEIERKNEELDELREEIDHLKSTVEQV